MDRRGEMKKIEIHGLYAKKLIEFINDNILMLAEDKLYNGMTIKIEVE